VQHSRLDGACVSFTSFWATWSIACTTSATVLSAILAFIGFKLVNHALHLNELPFINDGKHVEIVPEIPTWLSLVVIVLTLTVGSSSRAWRVHSAKSPRNNRSRAGKLGRMNAASPRPRTLAEKVWDDHLVVKGENGEPDLLYIDLHLVHEVTSPQAFDGLRQAGGPFEGPI